MGVPAKDRFCYVQYGRVIFAITESVFHGVVIYIVHIVVNYI